MATKDMEGTFKNLRKLAELVNKVPDIERRVNSTIERNNRQEERNVLQCPKDSLSSLHNLRMEVKDISKDQFMTHSKLQFLCHDSQKMINTADKILCYLEEETSKAENFLAQFGYVSVDSSKRKNTQDDSVFESSAPSEKAAANSSYSLNPVTKEDTGRSRPDFNAAKVEEIKQTDDKERGHFFQMPKSPDAPLFAENFKRESLHSPDAPFIEPKASKERQIIKEEPAEKNFGVSQSIPQKLFSDLPESPSLPDVEMKQTENLPQRFFQTPCAVDRKRQDPSASKFETGVPFFSKLTASPDSPKTVYTKNAETEFTSTSPGLTLYSRRSVLIDVPERANTIDDDTVYNLHGARGVSQFMRTPESPDLTEFKGLPKIQHLENHSKLPDTPPSPDLTSHTDIGVGIKENIKPQEKQDLSTYRIKEGQYQGLPEFLKRLIPYDVGCECLKEVLQASFALPGDKYASVITEAKIVESTSLGTKTKSFLFALQSLKIIQRIRGTEYFEIII